MSRIIDEIQVRLFEMQDLKYRDFNASLIPTVDKDKVIGVRTPALRKMAKELAQNPEITEFLTALPHQYYEENNLHGMIIEQEKDFGRCISEVEKFLSYIDNWATCDLISPKVFRKHTEEMMTYIRCWMESSHTYTCRFGIKMLMTYFLDNNFRTEYSEWVAAVKSEEYYVNMMRAWYFATALAKQYDRIIPFIEEKRLDKWTHNKSIQKSVESYRITPEQKKYLRTLKVK